MHVGGRYLHRDGIQLTALSSTYVSKGSILGYLNHRFRP